ncbi:glutathione S-transferase family protein [Segnochrobactraceae bacterium EtOH-i3]
MSYTLVIANRRYSSWSLRAWLVATHFRIPVEEVLIPLDTPETKAQIRAFSPSGRVPCLVGAGAVVWDSLAIIEYLAETVPEKAIWPRDRLARAHARSIVAEMHSGFMALRSACPMNLRRTFPFRDRGAAVAADVARITALWADTRARFGAGGPFLFGAFSAADAFYAPVVLRLLGYGFPLDAGTAAYCAAVTELPDMQAWMTAAAEEPWIVSADEVDA